MTVTADTQALQELLTRWTDAIGRGDAAAFAELFAPDGAVLYPDARPPSLGREAVRRDVAGLIAATPASGATLSQPAIEVHGDWAQILADFRATWTGRGTSLREHSRYFLAVRRQADGRWRVARFTFFPLP